MLRHEVSKSAEKGEDTRHAATVLPLISAKLIDYNIIACQPAYARMMIADFYGRVATGRPAKSSIMPPRRRYVVSD